MTQASLIETREITVRFGGNVAVDGVSLAVEPFSLKSIIGPNGAGKTTLFNLISGQYRPSAGQVIFKGRDITPLGPAERTSLGIGRSFQLTNLFPNLSALENVRLAVQAHSGLGMNFWRDFRSFGRLEEQARQLLDQVLLDDHRDTKAATLTHGEQRKLELAMLLGLDPEVMLLDEPTAGMSLEEVPAILEIISAIKAARNRTILLVEHKFDMIMSLSDSIAVLQDGRLICDDRPDKVAANPVVLEAYLGGGARSA